MTSFSIRTNKRVNKEERFGSNFSNHAWFRFGLFQLTAILQAKLDKVLKGKNMYDFLQNLCEKAPKLVLHGVSIHGSYHVSGNSEMKKTQNRCRNR